MASPQTPVCVTLGGHLKRSSPSLVRPGRAGDHAARRPWAAARLCPAPRTDAAAARSPGAAPRRRRRAGPFQRRTRRLLGGTPSCCTSSFLEAAPAAGKGIPPSPGAVEMRQPQGISLRDFHLPSGRLGGGRGRGEDPNSASSEGLVFPPPLPVSRKTAEDPPFRGRTGRRVRALAEKRAAVIQRQAGTRGGGGGGGGVPGQSSWVKRACGRQRESSGPSPSSPLPQRTPLTPGSRPLASGAQAWV